MLILMWKLYFNITTNNIYLNLLKVCKRWNVNIDVNDNGIVNVKGSDRQWKAVELSMQCCGKLLSDSFETC